MTEKFVASAVAILLGVIGVAVIATLVSRQSNTPNVINAGAGGFSQMLACALSPITGGRCASAGSSLTESVNSTITFPGNPISFLPGGRGDIVAL